MGRNRSESDLNIRLSIVNLVFDELEREAIEIENKEELYELVEDIEALLKNRRILDTQEWDI